MTLDRSSLTRPSTTHLRKNNPSCEDTSWQRQNPCTTKTKKSLSQRTARHPTINLRNALARELNIKSVLSVTIKWNSPKESHNPYYQIQFRDRATANIVNDFLAKHKIGRASKQYFKKKGIHPLKIKNHGRTYQGFALYLSNSQFDKLENILKLFEKDFFA